jgi:hypothetical protein
VTRPASEPQRQVRKAFDDGVVGSKFGLFFISVTVVGVLLLLAGYLLPIPGWAIVLAAVLILGGAFGAGYVSWRAGRRRGLTRAQALKRSLRTMGSWLFWFLP